jgi:fibronectin-binding autotransporter adhesin
VQNLSGGLGSGIVKLGGNTLTDVNTGSNSFNGVISGTGGLTLQGSGSLTLNNIQTYTGPTIVKGGTLALRSNSVGGIFGVLPGVSIAASSGLNLAAPGATFSLDSAPLGAQTIQDLSGVAGSSVNLGTASLAVGTANSTTFGGMISGLVSMNGLIKQGTGTLTLTGANTYVGPTIINAGTLALAGFSGSIAKSSGVNLAGPAATFDASGAFFPTIQGLTGVTGSKVNLGNSFLFLNQTGTSKFAGSIAGGDGSFLILQGTGSEVLTGVSTLRARPQISESVIWFL